MSKARILSDLMADSAITPDEIQGLEAWLDAQNLADWGSITSTVSASENIVDYGLISETV